MLIRRVKPIDVGLLLWADLFGDEGNPPAPETDAQREARSAHLAAFATDPDKGGFVFVNDGEILGVVIYRFLNVRSSAGATESCYRTLDRSLLPSSGDVCEIVNLWVAPDHRRNGIGTHLVLLVEEEAMARAVTMIFSHPRDGNTPALYMNRKLKYVEVRRGTLWDSVERVSLTKRLERRFKAAE